MGAWVVRGDDPGHQLPTAPPHWLAKARERIASNWRAYRMVFGILMLLFIGFQRLWHFGYIRHDAMLGGILRVTALPVVSTCWRYLRSMSIIQSQSLARLGERPSLFGRGLYVHVRQPTV